MILEVSGTSTRNKGAELMLSAIREHYAGSRPEVQLAVASGFGTYEERVKHGLWTKLPTGRWGRWRVAGALMPAAFRRTLGVVAEREVEAVLDASGFAFGDQLGVRRSRQFAGDVRRWKRQGKTVVLLPQAFGPFETAEVREAFRPVVGLADLIFARDVESLRHLEGLGGAAGRLRVAPDFTTLVAGSVGMDDACEAGTDYKSVLRGDGGRACIVPNHRMVEKTPGGERERYVPFLACCVEEARNVGLEPFVLLHDAEVDRELVGPLQKAVGGELRVESAADPRVLKGTLGEADVVIGSRFHALVGALSQGVPCIGAGWSHKYQMLFDDYECPENLLGTDASVKAIHDAFARVCGGDSRAELVGRLDRAGARQRDRVREMWREVDGLLGLSVADDTDDTGENGASGETHTTNVAVGPVK
jgi:Polysaccharide pyruvyl transferase